MPLTSRLLPSSSFFGHAGGAQTLKLEAKEDELSQGLLMQKATCFKERSVAICQSEGQSHADSPRQIVPMFEQAQGTAVVVFGRITTKCAQANVLGLSMLCIRSHTLCFPSMQTQCPASSRST